MLRGFHYVAKKIGPLRVVTLLLVTVKINDCTINEVHGSLVCTNTDILLHRGKMYLVENYSNERKEELYVTVSGGAVKGKIN